MKRISAKALLITGLVVTFGSPFFIEFFSLAYPNMPEKIGMPLVFSFYFSGTILFVLSLAKSRMEKGKIKADNIIKAMTPAQICLISSMIILFIGELLGELINETVGGIFGGLGFICFNRFGDL